jgi:hypothetical protein
MIQLESIAKNALSEFGARGEYPAAGGNLLVRHSEWVSRAIRLREDGRTPEAYMGSWINAGTMQHH